MMKEGDDDDNNDCRSTLVDFGRFRTLISSEDISVIEARSGRRRE